MGANIAWRISWANGKFCLCQLKSSFSSVVKCICPIFKMHYHFLETRPWSGWWRRWTRCVAECEKKELQLDLKDVIECMPGIGWSLALPPSPSTSSWSSPRRLQLNLKHWTLPRPGCCMHSMFVGGPTIALKRGRRRNLENRINKQTDKQLIDKFHKQMISVIFNLTL